MWAENRGVLVQPSYIDDKIASGRLVYATQGAEHVVYYDETAGRAVKVTHPGLLILEYLDRLFYSNQAFGDDVEIVGVLGEGPRVQLVTSQQWIDEDEDAAYPQPDEIDAFFAGLKFLKFTTSAGEVAYYNRDLDLIASDAHGGNFIRSMRRIIPIDVIVARPTDEMRSFYSALNVRS